MILSILPLVVERPKQITARCHVTKPRDRLLAFLNANNPGGFTAEEVQSLDKRTIGGMLEYASQWDTIGLDSFKKFAWKIKKLSGGAIKHNQCLNMVSVLFGYKDWEEVSVFFDRSERLINRRNAQSTSTVIYQPARRTFAMTSNARGMWH